MSAAALSLEGVEVVLGGMPTVRDLSLEVAAGEVVVLAGRNGSGRSTVLRATAGLEHVSAGRILLWGREVQNRPAHRVAALGCGIVLEGARVFRRLTVEANLRLGAYGCPRAEVRRRIDVQLVRFPGLADRLHVPAGSLSGGQQAMLALAQGLMAAPTVLLLDEPALGLDDAAVGRLVELLGSLRREGLAVLAADQTGGPVVAAADRALLMELGRLVDARPPG